jgi:hypothetical protein
VATAGRHLRPEKHSTGEERSETEENDMDQNPTNKEWGTGTSGSMSGGATGFGTGTTPDNSAANSGSSFGVTSATESAACPTCGHSKSAGLEQLLGRLGINEEMVSNLKGQFQNVDIDEYLNTARDYLKDGSNKASTYAKEHPGKVAAGFAALALGAGLLYAASNRDK